GARRSRGGQEIGTEAATPPPREGLHEQGHRPAARPVWQPPGGRRRDRRREGRGVGDGERPPGHPAGGRYPVGPRAVTSALQQGPEGGPEAEPPRRVALPPRYAGSPLEAVRPSPQAAASQTLLTPLGQVSNDSSSRDRICSRPRSTGLSHLS